MGKDVPSHHGEPRVVVRQEQAGSEVETEDHDGDGEEQRQPAHITDAEHRGARQPPQLRHLLALGSARSAWYNGGVVTTRPPV